MDVLGSIGTLTTHEAALEVAKSKPNLLERYLWALAQCPTVDIKISEGNQVEKQSHDDTNDLLQDCWSCPRVKR